MEDRTRSLCTVPPDGLSNVGVVATPEELAKYIQFQLDRLGERNAHHEFEHLCRRVAAARIASNLLPATGPVSGGGDQGSDFDTHPSELSRELGPGHAGSWLALSSQKRLAFVCTIQRKNLRPKIEADVATILEHGDPPDRIHAFVAGAIGKGQRAKCIRNIREQHRVELVVHDAVYLAETLAMPDLFWVAQRYLDVPDALQPPELPSDYESPDWYLADRERWRLTEPSGTVGELLDLTDGLRRATYYEHARSDTGFWLGLMRSLAETSVSRSVRQGARYEVAVAVLRGQGTLFPVDHLVRQFFADVRQSDSPDALKRASTLLQYVRNAAAYGQTDIARREVHAWSESLHALLGERIETEDGPNRLAELLATNGFLYLQLDFDQIDDSATPRDMPFVGERLGSEEIVALARDSDMDPDLLVDVDRGVAHWLRLARMLDQAPLFDVDELAILISTVTPALVDHESWPELTDRVERALARQAGQAVVAARCRDRAMLLRQRGRHREAIAELHRAKVDWWSGSTLRGALMALLIAADSYRELGLNHAAAQFALAVAFIADSRSDSDHRDLVAPALAMVAGLEYRWGAWLGATELVEATLVAAHHYHPEGVDLEEQFAHETLIVGGFLEAGAPVLLGDEAGAALVDALERVAVTDLLGGDPRTAVQESGTFADTRAWDIAGEGSLTGPPFQDLSHEYILQFVACGVHFVIRADAPNDSTCRRACERFAAAAQVLLLELADDDLCLLHSRLEATIAVGAEASDLDERWRPSAHGREWRFTLSASVSDLDRVSQELLKALSLLILDASLLPSSAYMRAVESAFERGLTHKLLFGRAYDELRQAFTHSDLQASVSEARRDSRTAPWPLPDGPRLLGREGPGPTFTEIRSQDLVQGRYHKMTERIPRQIRSLRFHPGFRQVVAELRRRGWRDHHVLLAVYNITLNFRMGVAGLDPLDPNDAARARRMQEEPETASTPLAPSRRFTVANMDEARRMALPATLKIWDLVLHAPTPDLDAIEALLAERYEYWDADADHAPIFDV